MIITLFQSVFFSQGQQPERFWSCQLGGVNETKGMVVAVPCIKWQKAHQNVGYQVYRVIIRHTVHKGTALANACSEWQSDDHCQKTRAIRIQLVLKESSIYWDHYVGIIIISMIASNRQTSFCKLALQHLEGEELVSQRKSMRSSVCQKEKICENYGWDIELITDHDQLHA